MPSVPFGHQHPQRVRAEERVPELGVRDREQRRQTDARSHPSPRAVERPGLAPPVDDVLDRIAEDGLGSSGIRSRCRTSAGASRTESGWVGKQRQQGVGRRGSIRTSYSCTAASRGEWILHALPGQGVGFIVVITAEDVGRAPIRNRVHSLRRGDSLLLGVPAFLELLTRGVPADGQRAA